MPMLYLYINCLVHDPIPNFDTLPKMSYISMFLLRGPKHKVLANKREDGKCWMLNAMLDNFSAFYDTILDGLCWWLTFTQSSDDEICKTGKWILHKFRDKTL